jgi:hypothetical protein
MGTKMDISTPSDEASPFMVNLFLSSIVNTVFTFPIAEIVQEIVDRDEFRDAATNYEKLTTFT